MLHNKVYNILIIVLPLYHNQTQRNYENLTYPINRKKSN